ncbi:MAG: hypothetical protein ACM3KM_03920 [Acidobacteriaceae bacterium]
MKKSPRKLLLDDDKRGDFSDIDPRFVPAGSTAGPKRQDVDLSWEGENMPSDPQSAMLPFLPPGVTVH